MPSSGQPAAAMIGVPGTRLEASEKAHLRRMAPVGVVLFKRNVDTPDQVRALIADIRESLGENVIIAVDQEGGRVARFGPPHWPVYPPAARIGALYDADRDKGLAAGFALGRLIGEDLRDLGVTMNFAPVADLSEPGGHDVIGDRAFSDDPDAVAELARAMMDGLLAAGITPVVKHAPGHGRARADSHEDTPIVDTPLIDLEMRDFIPFYAVGDAPVMMTAHIIYPHVDEDHVATVSPRVLTRVIRNGFGFQGVLVSDDLAMKALTGRPSARADAARRAGCDIVLWCEPDYQAAEEVCRAAGPLGEGAEARLRYALSRPASRPAPIDMAQARADFDAFFAS